MMMNITFLGVEIKTKKNLQVGMVMVGNEKGKERTYLHLPQETTSQK